jgi:hypothetical protein
MRGRMYILCVMLCMYIRECTGYMVGGWDGGGLEKSIIHPWKCHEQENKE